MTNAMTQMKATAQEHLRRDTKAGGKWLCTCEACSEIRSLMGMDKMLDVRPMVREIQNIGERLEALPDGPERQNLLEQYLDLHDKLAELVAK
jgi:hypothetical protein